MKANKMYWVPLFGAILLATSLKAYPYGGSNLQSTELGQIRNLFKNKCVKNSDLAAFIKLENYVLNNYNLFDGVPIARDPSYQELVNLTCLELRPKAYNYLTNIVERLEPCLDLDEKYLLNAMLRVHNSSYGNDCKDGGKILLNEIDAFKSARCSVGLYTGINEIAYRCLPSLNVIQHLSDANYVWIKRDFCSDIKNLQNCVEKYLKEVCNNEQLIHAFNLEYAHLLNTCEDSVITNEV